MLLAGFCAPLGLFTCVSWVGSMWVVHLLVTPEHLFQKNFAEILGALSAAVVVESLLLRVCSVVACRVARGGCVGSFDLLASGLLHRLLGVLK